MVVRPPGKGQSYRVRLSPRTFSKSHAFNWTLMAG